MVGVRVHRDYVRLGYCPVFGVHYKAFIVHKFSDASLKMVKTINQIMGEYERQGFRLSLHQLYYQLVARDFIPNSQNLIHWENPAEIVRDAAREFRIDKWQEQPYHIEVMVEKDALSGVLEPVCREMDIGITANKGYSSSSTMYEIGKRLYRQHADCGKDLCVLYLGDHDPSGIDMTRDVEERLQMYSTVNVEVVQLALNWDQVEMWNPPENPAKETDARFAAYAEQYRESSWELDAVEPATLAELVRDAVIERRDIDLWDEAIETENEMRGELQTFVKQYNDRKGK